MPSRAIALSRSVANLLEHRRKALGFTLREVARLAAEAGTPIPYSTLARIEQGILDPGVKRLQQLLRLYHVPLQVAGDLLDLEDMAGRPPTQKDPKALYRLATAAWHRGALDEALAAFIALRFETEKADPPLRQRATLAFAVAAGSLGKHRLSRFLLDDLLTHPLADDLLVPALLQSAIAWHWLGGYEASLAFLARAEHHVPRDGHTQRAWVLHERASILTDRGELDAASRDLRGALAAYRRAKDESGFGRALGLGVRIRFARDDAAGALRAARAARFHASRHRLHRHATNRRVDEGRAYASLGDFERAISTLDKALAESVERQDRAARFYAHFYLWDTLRRSGERDRARVEFEAAVYHLGFLDEVTPETIEMRRILANRGEATRTRR